VLRLLNEPTAAAIAYGLDKAAQGAFDISILKLTQGVFEVLATGGDSCLGGDDFDHAIADWFCAQHGTAGLADLPPGAQRSLLAAARKAKEALFGHETAALSLACACGLTQQAILSRDQFAVLGAPLIARSLSAIKRALRDAQLGIDDITGMVLVGGSTRMPIARDAVRAYFERDPLVDIDPDQVVAIGVALQAVESVQTFAAVASCCSANRRFNDTPTPCSELAVFGRCVFTNSCINQCAVNPWLVELPNEVASSCAR